MTEKEGWRRMALLWGTGAVVWLLMGIVDHALWFGAVLSLLIALYSHKRWRNEPEGTPPVPMKPWPKDGLFGTLNQYSFRLSMVMFGLGIMTGGVTAPTLNPHGLLAMIGIGVLLVFVASWNQYNSPVSRNDPSPDSDGV